MDFSRVFRVGPRDNRIDDRKLSLTTHLEPDARLLVYQARVTARRISGWMALGLSSVEHHMQSDTMPPPTLLENRDDARSLEEASSATWHDWRSAGRYNLVILGGGPAGILAAYAAAELGARVALIERNLLGGTCLNTGCIPSKSILRTSQLYADMRGAESFGAQVPKDIHVDFAAAMARMRR